MGKIHRHGHRGDHPHLCNNYHSCQRTDGISSQFKKTNAADNRPEKALKWLNQDLNETEIKSFLVPFDADKLKARPIKKINPRLPYDDDPGITVYYHYQELSTILASHPEYFEQSVDLRE